jgi:hypothetical protein
MVRSYPNSQVAAKLFQSNPSLPVRARTLFAPRHPCREDSVKIRPTLGMAQLRPYPQRPSLKCLLNADGTICSSEFAVVETGDSYKAGAFWEYSQGALQASQGNKVRYSASHISSAILIVASTGLPTDEGGRVIGRPITR